MIDTFEPGQSESQDCVNCVSLTQAALEAANIFFKGPEYRYSSSLGHMVSLSYCTAEKAADSDPQRRGLAMCQ